MVAYRSGPSIMASSSSNNHTLPYLQKLRKDTLVGVAEETGLADYDHLNKPDLIAALDKHLRHHQEDHLENPKLEDYYKRLLLPTPAPARSTPVKKEREREIREIKVESTPRASVTPDRSTIATSRGLRASTTTRRRGKVDVDPSQRETEPEPEPEPEPGTPSDAAVGNSTTTTSPTGAPLFPSVTSSPSLAAATGNVDRPTRWIRKRVYDSLSASRPLRWLNTTQCWLSDMKVIQTLIVTVEASWIIYHLLPSRTPTSFPDFLNLTSGSLWAPLSLWVLTNILVPLALAFLCNVSKATTILHHTDNRNRNRNGVSPTRSGSRSTAVETESDFDYLTFCIARGLISYIIYGNKVTVFGLFSRSSILKVNAAAPGKWVGMAIAAGVGGVESIYQAILKRGS